MTLWGLPPPAVEVTAVVGRLPALAVIQREDRLRVQPVYRIAEGAGFLRLNAVLVAGRDHRLGLRGGLVERLLASFRLGHRLVLGLFHAGLGVLRRLRLRLRPAGPRFGGRLGRGGGGGLLLRRLERAALVSLGGGLSFASSAGDSFDSPAAVKSLGPDHLGEAVVLDRARLPVATPRAPSRPSSHAECVACLASGATKSVP